MAARDETRKVYFDGMVLLADFAGLSLKKLLLGVLLAAAAGFLPRVVCSDVHGASRCVSLQLLQFSPLLVRDTPQVRAVARYMTPVSKAVARILDIGYAFIAACLIRTIIRGVGGRVWSSKLSRFFLLSAAASVVAYSVAGLWHIDGAPLLYRRGGIALDAATLLKDICDSAFFVSIAVLQIRYRPPVRTMIIRLRYMLAWILVVDQAVGLVYRYTGAVFAPDDATALALGIAWVVSPMQVALVLMSTYCRGNRRGAGNGAIIADGFV